MKVIIEMENKYPLNIYVDLFKCKPGDVIELPEDFYEGIQYVLTNLVELDPIDRIILEHKYKYEATTESLHEIYNILVDSDSPATMEYIEYFINASMNKLLHPRVYKYFTDGYYKATEYYNSIQREQLTDTNCLNDKETHDVYNKNDNKYRVDDSIEYEMTKTPRVPITDMGMTTKSVKMLHDIGINYVDELETYLKTHSLSEQKFGVKRIKDIIDKLGEYQKKIQ